jgi:hypothetical protein
MSGLVTVAMAPSQGIAAAPGAAPASMLASGTLRVMSYNIEGLPSPVKADRAASLERMGDRLAALRRAGRGPQVVMLQEAFIDPAHPIEATGGYRYVARGPSAAEANRAAPSGPIARGFAAGASALKGEGVGKWENSGLRILSDYPIVRVERMAFPEWACAGYDCLANKGALIAWIALPGEPRPVAFVDTPSTRAVTPACRTRAPTKPMRFRRRRCGASSPARSRALLPRSSAAISTPTTRHAGSCSGPTPCRAAATRSRRR